MKIWLYEYHNVCCFTFWVILVAVCPVVAISQQKLFEPSNDNAAFLEEATLTLTDRYNRRIKDLPGKNRDAFIKIYRTRWDHINDIFRKNEIYTNRQAQRFLDGMAGEVVRSNPLLQSLEFNCYFSKSWVPNAACLGEGLILLNLGLFTRLDNESQAAFILCHEMAHLYLQHSEKSIEDYVSTINSKEFQAELKNIKKLDYGKRSEVEKLVKGITFQTRRHGRDHEQSADSMAIVLMRNTRFDLSQSLTAMALLDSVDIVPYNMEELLERCFGTDEYPFQRRWLKKEEGLLGGHAILQKDEQLADSLKTHPDCQKRLHYLEIMVSQESPGSSSHKKLFDEKEFGDIKKAAGYEIVNYAYNSGNYTRSLLLSLEGLRNRPDDPFLIVQTGKIFNGLFEAQSGHIIGKMVDQPGPYFEPGYNILLQFVQNLYKNEYAAIGYYFLKQYREKMRDYSQFNNEFDKSLQLIKQ